MSQEATLEELSAAVLAVAARRSVRDVLQTIVSTARALLDAEYAALGVPDDQGGFGEFVVDGISDDQWDAIGPLPRQHGMLGVMLSDPHPQRLPDLRSDPRFGWWPAAHPQMGAFLGMPILGLPSPDEDVPDPTQDVEILGAIYLTNPHRRAEFTADDERLVGVLAAHAAIALTNARLFEQGRELTLVQERQRIARELHDAVAQTLFSLRLTAQAAATLVHRDPDRAAAEMATVAELAANAADELRQIVAELRPSELVHDGLAETLRTRIALLDRVHGAQVSFDLRSWSSSLQPKTEEAVLRVAEEALHNALRHAAAKHVSVTLTGTSTGATLEIVDDGAGFDPMKSADADRSRGSNRLGLASMRERSRSVRGHLSIRSAAGNGTVVRLEVPGG